MKMIHAFRKISGCFAPPQSSENSFIPID